MNRKNLEFKVSKLEKLLYRQKVCSAPKNTFNISTPFFIFIDLVIGMTIGFFIGYITDSYLKTTPFFTFSLCILGFLGSLLNIYKNLYNTF